MWDVVVVGSGNAAFCAAISARQAGSSVLMLERATEEECGGNSRFTAGAIRFAYDGIDDLRSVVTDLSDEEVRNTDFGSYPTSMFFEDMARVTGYRTDPELCETMVNGSLDTMRWLRELGVRFVPIYGRQAFNIDGKFKFWGGLTVEVSGGGPGLIDQYLAIAGRLGIKIEYASRVVSLIYDGQTVKGVKVKRADGYRQIPARNVVLASGGFQANAEWRCRYLGPGWELAKVRGTRFNTGDGHHMAMEIGASSAGNWSGCHAVGWDYNAPEFGDLTVGDGFQKHSYPFGIMINANGKRFVDEGADFRNYTYAKYGREILLQPNQFAWQVFDSKVTHLLRDEYRIKRVTKVKADTIEELAQKLEGVNAAAFLAEIAEYNASIDQSTPFNANVRDGRGTNGLTVPKTNWANTIENGPFEAYQVGCGITFTFGGLRIDPSTAQVRDVDDHNIPGLYAAGEIIGGLFYFNYPGGAGLMVGATFGRLAGRSAAGAGALLSAA